MIAERMKQLMNERDMSLQQLAEQSELPLETVRNIYYGKTPDPKVSTVMKLTKALNISVNCFMGQCSHTTSEKILLRNYRACGTHGRSVIELIAKYESGAIKAEREASGKHSIPCLVPHGDIYNGIARDTCDTVEYATANPDANYSIKIITNDLAPIYCKDDIILIENRFPCNGECGAFFKGNRVYIRKFIEEEKQYRLKCLHNRGSDMVFKRMDSIEWMGTCIGVIRE